MDPLTERTLIAQCRAGNTAAFEPLVRFHEPRALAIAGALLGDEDDAADAVQDAFVKAYRSLRALRANSEFGPWFRTILRNLCIDRLRAPRQAQRRDLEGAADGALWIQPEAAHAVERAELASGVRAALAALSAEHREVLVLKEIEGLSYEEIARATGVPSGTVASRLYHARAALKKLLVVRGVSLEEAS